MFADGGVTEGVRYLVEGCARAGTVNEESEPAFRNAAAVWNTLRNPVEAAATAEAILTAIGVQSGSQKAVEAKRYSLSRLLRDLFGPLPFRTVTLDPAWLAWNEGTIPQLTQAVYEERELPTGHLDTARLSVLANALEEAGCDNADILGHCRGPGPHVRGCFVVDALLGKT
jgi:hypothetical protein